jgi:hypothetical protein
MTQASPQPAGVQPQHTPFSWAFGHLNEQPHMKVIRLQTVVGPVTLFCTGEELARLAADAAREAKGSNLVVPQGPLPPLPGDGLPR